MYDSVGIQPKVLGIQPLTTVPGLISALYDYANGFKMQKILKSFISFIKESEDDI